MSVIAETRRRPATRIRRTAELWLVGIAMVLSTVGLGGFSLVMNQADAPTFERVILPSLLGTESGMGLDQAYEAGRTLGAWFGVTLIVVLLLSVVGIFFARRRPSRRSTGWWFLAAGLACLLGSQLILYPIAFVFFVSAGLFALRTVTDGSPS
ncbi:MULTISPECIES: DUF4064 domain-containing protein [Brachybacterium]|uniref:DUF4064 domain-containing protein n=1 Tax=Brachybacterium TaxID=43668 RepID=UPI000BB70722|nr:MULTISPECIES: DUF4064 domain-containing protein [Brachybacterium]PCC33933.1 hypothetical protein CIK71_07345 [Brachybacterium alimentarium]RCS62624.1 DUF4064 domain-containing protein [Brachybacterium alimentarium]RCS66437.1 DUF4064 domain-containing protein [Brachybacterium sp. JB7]RCS77727.1 DUF4064 domain-containing protein [Brachybacterium alimentarium]RCS78713.1 DUF4064 domain-containing protein [Brachybacterium alimentarium]